MTQSVCITGASRGIGLEFVQQLAKNNWDVYAVTRHPEAKALLTMAEQYPNVHIVQGDITNFHELSHLAKQFEGKKLDILINNAGTSGVPNQRIGQVDPENMQQVFKTNTIAPIMVCQTLLPALERGSRKLIVNITSRMGSIADNDSGGSYAYRSSKSALNAIMHSLQIDLKDKGFKVLLLHPGWVKTDMGGASALVTTEASVKKMLSLIEQANDLAEEFYHFEGEVLPW